MLRKANNYIQLMILIRHYVIEMCVIYRKIYKCEKLRLFFQKK